MNRQRVAGLGAWLGIMIVIALSAMATSASAATRHRPAKSKPKVSTAVQQIPVTFSVINNDSSMLGCRTDGKSYTISGTLFLPAGATPTGVTLYAHGLGYTRTFWDFTAVPGYDYAGYEADHGHASVIIDRLGYGASGKPAGADSCLGGQASILHQIITDLRSGAYGSTAGAVPSFSRIGLVGHSVGGAIAEIEAYSYGDIQALGIMDWADGDYSPEAYSAFGADAAQCLTFPETAGPGGPTGYSPFGASATAYNTAMFNSDTDPAVISAADAERALDPCGDIPSVLSAAVKDLTKIGAINVPIAYVWGKQDALFPAGLPWAALQEGLYRSSPKVTNIELPDSGHAVTLSPDAGLLMSQMDAWLSASGL